MAGSWVDGAGRPLSDPSALMPGHILDAEEASYVIVAVAGVADDHDFAHGAWEIVGGEL